MIEPILVRFYLGRRPAGESPDPVLMTALLIAWVYYFVLLMLFFAGAYLAWGALCIWVTRLLGAHGGWVQRALFFVAIPVVSVDGFKRFNKGNWSERHFLTAMAILACFASGLLCMAILSLIKR